MEALIYLFIFLIAVILSKIKFNKWINISSLFTGMWCGFGMLSTFGINHVRCPSVEVHMYAWLFVAVVNTVLLSTSTKPLRKEEFSGYTGYNYEWNYKESHILSLQIIASVLYIPVLIPSIGVFLKTGSLTAVRNAYFSGWSAFNNPIVSLLSRSATNNMMNALIIAYMYVAINNRKPKFILLAVLNVLIQVLGNGGRGAILTLILTSIILLSIQPRGYVRQRVQNAKRGVKKGIVVAVVIMGIVTALRGQSLIKSGITYFAGSLSFLDYILQYPDTFGLNHKLYGYLTFGGLLEPVVLLLKYIGVTTAKIPSYYFNIVCQPFYNIGVNNVTRMFNNNTSVLYYFLRDFGALGIIIGGILLGGLTTWSYKKMVKRNDARGTMLYVYFSVILLFSIMTYTMFGTNLFFTIFSIWYCTKPKSHRFRIK